MLRNVPKTFPERSGTFRERSFLRGFNTVCCIPRSKNVPATFWERSGTFRERFRNVLECFWNGFGCPNTFQKRARNVLERSGNVAFCLVLTRFVAFHVPRTFLERSCNVLERAWNVFGTLWNVLERFRGPKNVSKTFPERSGTFRERCY